MLQPKISTVKFMQSHENIIHLRSSKYQFMIGFIKLNSLKFSIISLYGRRIKGWDCSDSIKLFILIFEKNKRVLLLLGDIFSPIIQDSDS